MCGLEDRGCRDQIHGFGDLAIHCLTGDDHDGTARSFDQRGVVGCLLGTAVRSAERVDGKALRGLHGKQLLAVHDPTRPTTNRVRNRHAGHDGIGAVAHRRDHLAEQVGRGERPGGVVHEDDLAVGIQGVQTRPYGTGAGAAAGDDTKIRPGGGHKRHRIHRVGGNDHHHADRHGARSVNRPLEDGNAGKIGELFALTKTQSRATCNNDGPHRIHADCGGTCRIVAHVTIIAYVMVDSSLLASVDLFRDVDSQYIAELSAAATERSLWRGDVLFSEGQEPDALYIVTSGRIAIANKSIDGRESVVALMEEGDLFGEMGLFDGLGRSAEARALEPSKVAEIPYDPVRRTYEAHPELLWRVVDMLARRLRSMDEALADSVFLDVTGRTAKRLLELAGDADEFTLPITQEELSGMVGASRERVNKAISAFIRLGWLSQTDRRYTITNRKQLEIRSR